VERIAALEAPEPVKGNGPRIIDLSPVDGCVMARRYTAQEYRRRHPGHIWYFNPWSGTRRDSRDIASDPTGQLIISPGMLLRPYVQESAPPDQSERIALLEGLLREATVVLGNDAEEMRACGYYASATAIEGMKERIRAALEKP